MITIRHRDERGPSGTDWLDSQHSFSFGHYQDPNHMGFGPLRVLNEDKVIPGAGFSRHSHNDMEIVSYVLDGGLEHKDSIGTGSVIRPGDIQRMSAGTGISHSEYNASKTDPVHFLQIWFLPEKMGIEPGYAQASINQADTDNVLKLVMSQDGRDQTVTINQDIDFYVSRLNGSDALTFETMPGRIQWVQIAKGAVDLNDNSLQAGDGAAITDVKTLRFENAVDAEILLFDMVDTRTESAS